MTWAGLYRVVDWTQVHTNFFRALAIEKRMMSIILFLIVAVAAFNIVSTLVMVVTDKQSDIAVLRTLGASPGGVMGIFMVQGTAIGLVGTLIGVVAGVLLALNVEPIVGGIEAPLRHPLPGPEHLLHQRPALRRPSVRRGG